MTGRHSSPGAGAVLQSGKPSDLEPGVAAVFRSQQEREIKQAEPAEEFKQYVVSILSYRLVHQQSFHIKSLELNEY